MALKAMIKQDEYDELGDDMKAEYKESGDGFMLDVTAVGGFALEDVGGLKKTASSERAARKKAEASLDVYKDDEGEFLDADGARDAMKSLADGRPDDVEKAVKDAVALRDSDLKKRHGSEMDKITKKYDSVVSKVSKSLIGEGMTTAIAKAGGNHVLLAPKMVSESRMIRNSDGDFVLEILDEAGNPRTGNGPDGNMTFDERLVELKGDTNYGAAFKGSGQSGSGDRNSDNRSSNSSQKTVSRDAAMHDPALLAKVQNGEMTFSD